MGRTTLLFAGWTFLAGIGIPLIGPPNSAMAHAVGNPFAATAAMFAIAFTAAAALTLAIHGAPTLAPLRTAPASSWGAGLALIAGGIAVVQLAGTRHVA